MKARAGAAAEVVVGVALTAAAVIIRGPEGRNIWELAWDALRRLF